MHGSPHVNKHKQHKQTQSTGAKDKSIIPFMRNS